MNLEERVAALEGRLRSVEAVMFKRGGVSGMVGRLVRDWPGPFTFQQVHEAVCKQPGMEDAKLSQCQQRLYKMEKQGLIIRTHQGRGSVANIFERAAHAPQDVSRRVNRRHDYESGFRHIVRSAMASEDLPEEFTLADVQRWMAAHMPEVKIPYGSWSSTLYKLQGQGEIVVAKQRHTTRLKVYRRGERVVMPSGEEMAELEKSWTDFKKKFEPVKSAESWKDGAMSSLERGENSAQG
jgi:hypothetical protein